MIRTAIAWIAVAATLVLAACGGREHLREDFGKRTHLYFALQHVRSDAAPGAPAGLDSEEAGIVYTTYRKQIGKEVPAQDAPAKVLLLEEPKSEKKKP